MKPKRCATICKSERVGRSVVLTPSTASANTHAVNVASNLPSFQIFDKDDIEADKAPFVQSASAVAILANRYDGIDFPGDECRLLCLDGLPRAMNSQERFIMSKMGAASLYNERIQTRVLQAAGRCTRALQDRSAVFVTGTELVDFLADSRKWTYFHPELQAELSFGVNQSTNVTATDIVDNFEMFLQNNAGWAAADQQIRIGSSQFSQSAFPAMDELASVVRHEVGFQNALWNHDYAVALTEARTILGHLKHPDLRGYRALWHYLAGAAALRMSTAAGDTQALAAQEQFGRAKNAAPAVSWLNNLSRALGLPETAEDIQISAESLHQVELLEKQFLGMGTVNNSKFEKKVAEIMTGLGQSNTFESAHVELGTLLGFAASNNNGDAAPDPWWLGEKLGVVFEDHADGQDTTIFGATKARQAASHPKWIKANVPGTAAMEILPILITPCVQAKKGAAPQLDAVRYWLLADFVAWANKAIPVLRNLKGTFPGEGDLAWRAEAQQWLEAEGLTLEALVKALPMATDVMKVVD